MLFKKNTTRFIFLVTLFVMLLSSYGCKKDDNKNPGYPKTVTIEYKITATGINKCDIIYTNETGGNTSLTDQALPFSKKFVRTVKQFDALSLGITALGNGSIKAEMFVDNNLVKTETFSGNSVIVGTPAYIFP